MKGCGAEGLFLWVFSYILLTVADDSVLQPCVGLTTSSLMPAWESVATDYVNLTGGSTRRWIVTIGTKPLIVP